MSMANDYCNASIALDKSHASSAWNKNTDLSNIQREKYMDQEINESKKLLSRYPHKYIATLKPPKHEGAMLIYDVKLVFSDGSEIVCLPMPLPTLESLRNDGAVIEITS